MRQAPLLYVVFLVLVVLIVPALLVRWLGTDEPLPGPLPGGDAIVPDPPPGPLQDMGIDVLVYFDATGQTVAIPLEEYVTGVVAAEMPPAFADEALKAQAVLARTYAVRKMRAFGGPGGCGDIEDADVCGDFRDQAYVTYPELVQKLGEAQARAYWQRIVAAVTATAGEIVTYEGEPIVAVYHSTSAGMTEDAAEVWGHAYPYLQPVPSDDRTSFRYEEQTRIPLGQVASEFGVSALPAAAGEPAVAAVGQTAGGRVRSVRIGTETVPATEFRQRLGLRSTNFVLREEGGELVITTYGYGHGVGMSQFGANEMAEAGRDYREIIAHYYQGVEVHYMFTE